MTANQTVGARDDGLLWGDSGLQVAVSHYRPGQRMPPHAHDTWGISVVLAGRVDEMVTATARTGTAASVVVKPPGTLHANRFGASGARILSLLVHPGHTDRWLAGHARLSRWDWLDAAPSLRIACRLAGRLQCPADGADGAEAADAALVGLIALVTPGRPLPGGRPPRWLVDVRDRVHAEFTSCCRVRRLAEAAGVHPVYLARAYRRYFGRSVTEELQALRARAAADRLAATREPIGRIASSLGFADQSHLCRAFARVAGAPPSAYRTLFGTRPAGSGVSSVQSAAASPR